ncbi:O-methyltransferase [Bacillus piscicola]|uniref:O-methyltransferase n=1 Tax=Bacillus piscicola TaxID=1632684 RepID=UPI001F09F347|nr:O-methyltransferase [Bacillus piscicola]
MYNDQQMIEYVNTLKGNKPSYIQEMEEEAARHKIPIMEQDSFEVMLQILELHQSVRILEIGTAIGYSALRIAHELPDIHVTSVEKDQGRYERAMVYREKSGLETQTNFYCADALADTFVLDADSGFDVIFIDAAKGKNKEFFTRYVPFLNEKGLVITDNVFFKGLTAVPEEASGRVRPMVEKIREYNEWLTTHSAFKTRFLTVGDGLAISQKIE